jgi:hypothetical protein
VTDMVASLVLKVTPVLTEIKCINVNWVHIKDANDKLTNMCCSLLLLSCRRALLPVARAMARAANVRHWMRRCGRRS